MKQFAYIVIVTISGCHKLVVFFQQNKSQTILHCMFIYSAIHLFSLHFKTIHTFDTKHYVRIKHGSILLARALTYITAVHLR